MGDRIQADSTPMWKHELERQSANPELLREIAEAVQRCRDQLNLSREPEDDPVAEDEEVALPDNEAPPLGRGAPRVRKAPERYSCTLVADPLESLLDILNNCIPPTFIIGIRVIAITIIPIPPNH